MKKVIVYIITLLLCIFSTMAFASDKPEPSQKVILFYSTSDSILQCQNSDEDIAKGTIEFEELLHKQYSKRFIVQEIRQLQKNNMTIDDYKAIPHHNQQLFIVNIEFAGEGVGVDHYQNGYGAQTAGAYKTAQIHLIESTVNIEDNCIYSYDYGVVGYGSGTFAVSGIIFATETNPRKIAKNAVRAAIQNACSLNKSINKYTNPQAYQNEIDRFTGNFKTKHSEQLSQRQRILAFEEWCKKDPEDLTRSSMLEGLQYLKDPVAKEAYIDYFIQAGIYCEEEK